MTGSGEATIFTPQLADAGHHMPRIRKSSFQSEIPTTTVFSF
jgi:hypothetical protein